MHTDGSLSGLRDCTCLAADTSTELKVTLVLSVKGIIIQAPHIGAEQWLL